MLLLCLHLLSAWLRSPSSGPANHLKRMDAHRDKIDSRIDTDSVTKRQTLQTPTAEQRVWRLFYACRNKLAAVDQTNKPQFVSVTHRFQSPIPNAIRHQGHTPIRNPTVHFKLCTCSEPHVYINLCRHTLAFPLTSGPHVPYEAASFPSQTIKVGNTASQCGWQTGKGGTQDIQWRPLPCTSRRE